MLKSKRLAACFLLAIFLAVNLVQPAAAITYIPGEPQLQTAASAPESVTSAEDTRPTNRIVSVVYRYASTTGTIIGCLENGTVLTVLSTSGKYYRIQCFEIKGYIPKSQVAQNENGEYYVNCSPDSSSTRELPVQTSAEVMALRTLISATAKKYIGVPYVWGGESPKGFDCSGFTQYVFRKHGYELNRSALQQLENGVMIAKEDLQCGDLVFFTNTVHSGSYASHIGIYLGNGKLIHAGSKGIAVVNFSDSYYQSHFLCARRVILSDLEVEPVIPSAAISQSINSSYWRENTQTESNGLGSFLPPGLASSPIFLYNIQVMSADTERTPYV
ncbi:MAG: NlpC/P60 family protein [Ruminococcaceae bacterium]|nr:NlpC/P60 family protein [Oscillospiraceae bacterium]